MTKTKISVAQIIHLVKAADRIEKFVFELVEKTPQAERGPLQVLTAAANTISRHVNDLQSAEITIKG